MLTSIIKDTQPQIDLLKHKIDNPNPGQNIVQIKREHQERLI